MADSGRRHPVLLYIHGESYDWGSGNPYDGSVLASYTDQVIVTMNYRLGVLGFLNANVAPQTKARVANYGLMDQIAALHWVKEHIALFGGDPNNVTLMGQGTGAACVHFLAISPTVIRGEYFSLQLFPETMKFRKAKGSVCYFEIEISFLDTIHKPPLAIEKLVRLYVSDVYHVSVSKLETALLFNLKDIVLKVLRISYSSCCSHPRQIY